MYKSINIGDFVVSVDCIQRKTPKRSLFSTLAPTPDKDKDKDKEATIDMENSERERIFYYPLVNNFSMHIRCMFSLWEGLINSAMSGSSSASSSKSKSKSNSKSNSNSDSKSTNWGLP